MRVIADVHRLPLATASVDMVIGNPPYPGNGVWEANYRNGIHHAVEECRRVLRSGAQGWFLLGKRKVAERWLAFNHAEVWWAHYGWSDFAVGLRPGKYWGVIPDDQIAPLILGHTDPGDLVLDPFAGRGGIPKLVARLGRVALGVDIDPDQLENGGPYA